MWIVQHRTLFFVLSGLLVGAAFALLILFTPRLGIEFTGGSLLEVAYEEARPAKDRVELRLEALELNDFDLRPVDEAGYLLRTEDLSEEERADVLGALSLGGAEKLSVERLNTIGPAIGTELRNKALVAIAVVVVMIIFFIAWAFRNVRGTQEKEEEPEVELSASARRRKRKKEKQEAAEAFRLPGVSSWTYGLIAIAALLHDILIPLGVFAILGVTMGAQIDVLFVMALLAILGYSVNDTIVVFDRVRENLVNNFERKKVEDFAETVGRSLSATIPRSINTSLTTLFVLVCLAVLGGETTRFFAFTLIAGVLAGTYSSIFIASPLLVAVERRTRKNEQSA